MNDKTLQKLSRMVEQDMPALVKNIIVPMDHDGYQAFGIYTITKSQKIYRVQKHGIFIATFLNRRTALSWCVADKYNKHILADDILKLEAKQQLLDGDLNVRTSLAKKIKSSAVSENVRNKLDRKRRMLNDTRFRLDKCINLAKYWQLRGFYNETARTGRTPSQRTSR